MKNNINYMMLAKSNFVASDKLKEFTKAGGYNNFGTIQDFEDVFIKSENENIDVFFIVDNDDFRYDILQNVTTVLKRTFPNMCLALFSNKLEKFTHLDYQFSLEEIDMKICSVLYRVKNLSEMTLEGFFIAPQKITELFDFLGINKKYKGYDYLKDAIELCCRNKIMYTSNMSKLYQYISQKYGVKESSIERCIRLVITESLLNIDYRKLSGTKYESLGDSIETSSNAGFIKAIVTFLSETMFA